MQNIKFMCMVDMLKKMTMGSYIPLSWCNGKEDRINSVVYDDYHPNEDGSFPVVWEYYADEEGNNGALSYFSNYCQPDFVYDVVCYVNDDASLNHITIMTSKENERPVTFFVQNGEWEAW